MVKSLLQDICSHYPERQAYTIGDRYCMISLSPETDEVPTICPAVDSCPGLCSMKYRPRYDVSTDTAFSTRFAALRRQQNTIDDSILADCFAMPPI